jgi:predicted Zn-ribbon and HTH transcriptional regulator
MIEVIEKQKCLRCGYEWFPRFPTPRLPLRCASCRNPLWSKPKVKFGSGRYREKLINEKTAWKYF